MATWEVAEHLRGALNELWRALSDDRTNVISKAKRRAHYMPEDKG